MPALLDRSLDSSSTPWSLPVMIRPTGRDRCPRAPVPVPACTAGGLNVTAVRSAGLDGVRRGPLLSAAGRHRAQNGGVAGPTAANVNGAWWDGPFVGREVLLAELVAAADDAAHGVGSIVLLTGEAGIGKTSVARLLARRVSGQLAVSWGACVAAQSAPPFWPWHTLVGAEPADPRRSTDGAVGAPRFEHLTALREQLRGQAIEQVRLHIIEDLQWADVASVLLLAHLATSIVDVPLLVVATLRTGEPLARPLDEAVEEVRRTSRVR